MSMPNFPEEGNHITRDQAFNMLLGSIAMEELGLSHIINAEGEKLQYVLGTLPCAPCPKPTTKELLEVNQSITTLLEHVAHNQLLLKSKLTQVLEAQEKYSPPCPPPPYPPSPCPPPCAHSCHKTDCFHVCCEGPWCTGQHLAWIPTLEEGNNALAHDCAETILHPSATGALFATFHFELIPNSCGPVTIALLALRGGSFTPLIESSVDATSPHETVHLSGSVLLTPSPGQRTAPPFVFSLCEPQQVQVKAATLTLRARH